MLKTIKKICSLFSAVCLILSAFSFSSYAVSVPKADMELEKTSDGYKILLYLTDCDGITGIDCTLDFSNSYVSVTKVTDVGTDAQNFVLSEDEFSDVTENENFYIYTYKTAGGKINYSGFFTQKYTNNEKFVFCEILIKANSESDFDILLDYKLKINGNYVSNTTVYSTKTLKEEVFNRFGQSRLAGDVDADGKVTSADARTILRISVALENVSVIDLPFANIDGDDTITASDAREALRIAVGLSDTKILTFEILPSKADCTAAGTFTFYCCESGDRFTLKNTKGEHVFVSGDCSEKNICAVCNEISKNTILGHEFNEKGKCTECEAYEHEIKNALNELISAFEGITEYDTKCKQAENSDDILLAVENAQNAVKKIKEAIEICKKTKGLGAIERNLKKAYDLRFDIFVKLTDENGVINVSRANFSKIKNAINESNIYIDFAIQTIQR